MESSAHQDELPRTLTQIAEHHGCRILPPAGNATLPAPFALPDDLRRFYQLCGGVVLFEGMPFTWRISGPREIVAASPRLLGNDLAQEIAAQQPDELTNSCFVIAETGPGSTASLMVVDLHPDRLGRYYDAFWDSYGLVGQMPILAVTLTELLRRLLHTHGTRLPQPEPGHGDAYDAKVH